VQTRIYRPVTVDDLRRLSSDGVLGPAPATAYAVTDDLRRQHAGADDEELEYLAFLDAARATESARVLAAADVDDSQVDELLDGTLAVSAVRVTAPVARRQVVSFHVADPNDASDAGEPASGIPAFSWYDATELDVVLELLA
jgi:hypothetical protein